MGLEHIETGIWMSLTAAAGYAIGLHDVAMDVIQHHFSNIPTLGLASIGATFLVSTKPVLEWLNPRLRRERREIEDTLAVVHETMYGLDGYIPDHLLDQYSNGDQLRTLEYMHDTFCASCTRLTEYINKRMCYMPELDRRIFINAFDDSHKYPAQIARGLIALESFYDVITKRMTVEGLSTDAIHKAYSQLEQLQAETLMFDASRSSLMSHASCH